MRPHAVTLGIRFITAAALALSLGLAADTAAAGSVSDAIGGIGKAISTSARSGRTTPPQDKSNKAAPSGNRRR